MKTSKFINIIHIINKIWFAITLCLFTTIILGFIAEIVLGYVQVLSSLLIIIKWKTFTKSVQYKLKVYWMITGLYLVLWLFDWNFLNDTFLYTIGVGIIPMCYVYSTVLFKHPQNHQKRSSISIDAYIKIK